MLVPVPNESLIRHGNRSGDSVLRKPSSLTESIQCCDVPMSRSDRPSPSMATNCDAAVRLTFDACQEAFWESISRKVDPNTINTTSVSAMITGPVHAVKSVQWL